MRETKHRNTAGSEMKDSLGDLLPGDAVQRLGTVRMSFPKDPCFAYLPDGRTVVAHGSRLEIWNMERLEMECVHETGQSDICSIACADDGRLAVAATADGMVLVWDLINGAEELRWNTSQQRLVSICLSSDQERLLTTGRSPATLKEWDRATGRERIVIRGPSVSFFLRRCDKNEGATLPEDGVTVPTPVQFSMGIYGPRGTTALVGDMAQASLLHYDLRTGHLIHEWHPDIYIRQLALSADGRRLLIGSRHRATEWDMDDYRLLNVFSGHHGHEATAVAYCRNPDHILTGSRDGSIRLWNRNEASVIRRWVPHHRQVTATAVSPDGKWVLSRGSGMLVESDINTGAPRVKIARHRAPVCSTVFLESPGKVASGSVDGEIRVWDVKSGKTLKSFILPEDGLMACDLAASPEGTRFAAAGHMAVWEFELPDCRVLRKLTGHRGFVNTVAYASDGQHLLSGADDGAILVWQRDTDSPIARLEGHIGGVLSLAVSPDSGMAISGGRDGTVRVWDLKAGGQAGICKGHLGWVQSVAFAGGNKVGLSAGYDGRVLKWDLRTCGQISEMRHGCRLNSLLSAPDGSAAYSAGEDGLIMCWNLSSATKIKTLPGHGMPIKRLAISKDGVLLVSASSDSSLLVWRT